MKQEKHSSQLSCIKCGFLCVFEVEEDGLGEKKNGKQQGKPKGFYMSQRIISNTKKRRMSSIGGA